MKPRKHLFIQLGSYPLAELAEHLEAQYQAGGAYVDLIVTQTCNLNGVLYAQALDILDPYLPWGAKRLAGNIFFGTNVDYTGHTDPYGADMLSGEFRWRLLNIQRTGLAALSKRYPNKPWHFYIEHEAVLEKITATPSLATAYEAFLIQSVRDFRQMYKPHAAVAWSPAFWNVNVPANAKTVLGNLFTRIKSFAGSPGLDWILLQDMTGRPWGGLVKAHHVKAWMDALGNSFRSKQVNVEQFRYVNGHMAPGDPGELALTEQSYRNLGLQIGACWELRWYMRGAEAAAPGLAELLSVGKGTTYKFSAHNTWASRLKQVRDWLSTGVHQGSYSRRAELAEFVGREIRRITGLEVQGIRYMRPVDSGGSGRSSNSDHFTAGAIDIMIRTTAEKAWLVPLYQLLDELQRRNVIRYRVDLGANAAHWDHIHVSFQIGAVL